MEKVWDVTHGHTTTHTRRKVEQYSARGRIRNSESKTSVRLHWRHIFEHLDQSWTSVCVVLQWGEASHGDEAELRRGHNMLIVCSLSLWYWDQRAFDIASHNSLAILNASLLFSTHQWKSTPILNIADSAQAEYFHMLVRPCVRRRDISHFHRFRPCKPYNFWRLMTATMVTTWWPLGDSSSKTHIICDKCRIRTVYYV